MGADILDLIHAEKKRLDAVILAHYYQDGPLQDIADFVGDSLQLARQAAQTKAKTIVFCGVHFMAETAKILAPDRLVVLPDANAGCSLADSCPADQFEAFVRAHPGHTVVTYVNSSAAIKAVSDYCCTSSNAVQVVESIPKDQAIIFAPDQYLGDYVARQTGRDLVLWAGSCEVHEDFSQSALEALRLQHPQAKVLVHPECPLAIRALAHVVGSTAQLLAAVTKGGPSDEWIVVTEPGIIHQMQLKQPKARFIPAPRSLRSGEQGSCTACNTCPHMRLNTLEKLLACMQQQEPRIELPANLIAAARKPIDRMLAIG